MYDTIRLATGRGPWRPDAVAVVLFESTRDLPAGYAAVDRSTGGALAAAIKRPEFSGALGSELVLYPARGPERLYVLGLGPRPRFGDAAPLRAALARLLRLAHGAAVRRLELVLGAGVGDAASPQRAGSAAGDGLAIANFDFDRFRSAPSAAGAARPPRPRRLQVRVDAAMSAALTRALRVGESVNLARTLAAMPPNVANPAHLVSFCRRMAREVGLRCTVLDAATAARRGMGGLVAVGAAGSTPPALICLEHRPPRQRRRGAAGGAAPGPVLLVGKAITFDTGGYSLKPAASMDGMKYDKSGGTAVIGAMHAIARLGVACPVVGLIPAAENLVGRRGYRPGDILRMYNGTTVEVTNTDAEGRLVLADALAYGCRTFRPRAIVDLATLTGGVVVALGSECAGAFCADTAWREHLFEAAADTGERLWQLPLWPEHRALLKSTHADLVNAGGREAHPIQGAAFLWHFVDEDRPWAHLDIAGVAEAKKDGDLFVKGPTGFGVRLLVRAIETLAAEPAVRRRAAGGRGGDGGR